MVDQPTRLVDIFFQEPNHKGLCNTSGIGSGGIWLDPSRSVKSIVWNQPWSTDIILLLVSDTNTWGMLTNYNLDLTNLIPHEATLMAAFHESSMSNPLSVSDNTPTVSWIMQ